MGEGWGGGVVGVREGWDRGVVGIWEGGGGLRVIWYSPLVSVSPSCQLTASSAAVKVSSLMK